MLARKLAFVVLCATLVSAGCSRATNEAPQTEEIQLRVENDIIPPVSFSIYAVNSTTGSRQLLGVVRPSETTTLRWDSRGADEYRFAAQPTGGPELISDEITLGGGDGAIWDLNTNVLTPM